MEATDVGHLIRWVLDANYYGLYRRVASHSFIGLFVTGSVAGTLVWLVTRVRPWRRFGWFVCTNLPAFMDG